MAGDIVFPWRGETLTIPATKAFALGEEIEDIAPLSEVTGYLQKQQFRKLSRVLSIMLRYAGRPVDPAEAFSELMTQIKRGTDGMETVQSWIMSLMDVMMDGIPQDDDAGKDQPAPVAAKRTPVKKSR